MTRRVVVSGASGFIGRWSLPALIAAGYEVHAVVRDAGRKALPAQLAGAVLHDVDLLDPDAVATLMAALEPSHLLHFAWIATPGVYWTSAENFRWLAAGKHLLQCFGARGGRRAVMAGTCAEYDWSRAGVCGEFTTALAEPDAGRVAILRDQTSTGGVGAEGGADAVGVVGGSATASPAVTPYAACKLAMQNVLSRFGESHGVSTAWGRVFFQYGPDEHPDRLVASAITHLLSGREAQCSHGRQIRSFLHVADVGAAFAALLDSAVEGPVNLGSDEPITIADLLGLIADQIGRPDLVRLGARGASPSEPPLLIPDIGRLRDEVGWSPQFTLNAGIADTIAWWRRQRVVAGSSATDR